MLMNIPFVRSFVWRLGRKLYCLARRESANVPETNGEYWLLETIIKAAPTNAPMLLDIGANKGNWSKRAVAIFRRRGLSGHIYAFEPTSSTFKYLSEQFKGSESVSPKRVALSDKSGEAEFFVIGELAGTNSMYPADHSVLERITSIRLDEFVEREGVEQILFAKCDTEGHDLMVLRGAEAILREGRVDVWQFEYNHRWVGGRAVLKDVFDFISDKPYLLGKLYGNGIEAYERWHPELERFFEVNYVLIRKGSPFESLCSIVRFDESNVPALAC